MTFRGHSVVEHPVMELLEGFTDVTHAFRFGPPSLDLVVASLCDSSGARLSEAFYFPLGLAAEPRDDLGLEAVPVALPGGDWDLVVSTRRFAQSVALDVGDLVPSDNFFHLSPGGTRTVRLKSGPGSAPSGGHAKALNADSAVAFILSPGPDSSQAETGQDQRNLAPASPRS